MKPTAPVGSRAILPLPLDVPPVDLRVLALLQRMMGELDQQRVQYLITGSYFLLPDGRRDYPAHLIFHRKTAWNLEPEEHGLACEVILQAGSTKRTRILIPYDVIFRIARKTRTDGSGFVERDIIYYNETVKKQLLAETH
jgi:hypothetical protein